MLLVINLSIYSSQNIPLQNDTIDLTYAGEGTL